MKQLLLVVTFLASRVCVAEEGPMDVWPDLAPGETTRLIGEKQPPLANETPPVTRVVNITRPKFTVHLAPKPNGTGVLILPGGGLLKARGGSADLVGQAVFVRNDVIEGKAPNLPLEVIEI